MNFQAHIVATLAILAVNVAPGDESPTVALSQEAEAQGAADGGVIKLDVHVQTKRKGNVHCALYDNKGDWLSRKVIASTKVGVSGEWVTCVFTGVKQAGNYAIAALHDEDGDGDMDKILGVPQEGYATSRDAQSKSLYPKWKNAVFSFSGGEVTQTAHMKY
jgi:uncharacterized protein (DUF2141 family)